MRWEELARSLEEKGQHAAATLPPMQHLQRAESQARLSELEARAQWLEEELATAREQFRKESIQLPPERTLQQAESLETASGGGARDPAARLALTANLLLASANLLAHDSHIDPAVLESVRGIQRRAQNLADVLRAQARAPSPEGAPWRTENPPRSTEL